jgi:alkanesulfonate monooxygenase SsuD/methylene tetrahydromethanopterin reductase-like flavin-dependent oxidoreductase (luciferase family)
LGIGKGFSPFELAYFGVGHLQADHMFREAKEVVLSGLQGETLTHDGEFYRYDHVPMALQPFQKPHPPLWQGVTSTTSAAAAGALGVNVITNGPAKRVRVLVDAYWKAWTHANDKPAAIPRFGLTRHIHVADDDRTAEAAARAAYAVWYDSNAELWRRFQTESLIFPRTYDDAIASGVAIVGSPQTVEAAIRRQLDDSGSNYLVGRFAFGNLSYEAISRCIELFAKRVMPAISREAA